jgi:hypothetical protein
MQLAGGQSSGAARRVAERVPCEQPRVEGCSWRLGFGWLACFICSLAASSFMFRAASCRRTMAVEQRFGPYLLDRSRPKTGHVPELAGLCLHHCPAGWRNAPALNPKMRRGLSVLLARWIRDEHKNTQGF